MLMRLEGQKVLRHKDGTAFLIYPSVPFEDTFYLATGSIRNFALQDVAVLSELVRMIKKLQERDGGGRFEKLFCSELEAIEEAAGQTLNSKSDLAYIQNLMR